MTPPSPNSFCYPQKVGLFGANFEFFGSGGRFSERRKLETLTRREIDIKLENLVGLRVSFRRIIFPNRVGMR